MHYLIAHYYDILIFLGIFFFGMPVLLPAVYASLHGGIDPIVVTFAALFAGVLSDTVWYAVGVTAGKRVHGYLMQKREADVKRVMALFEIYAFRLIFFSRFAYGMKTITNILAGSRRMPFKPFLCACVLSMTGWVALMYILAYAIGSIDILHSTVTGIQIGFLLVATLVLFIMGYARRKLQ